MGRDGKRQAVGPGECAHHSGGRGLRQRRHALGIAVKHALARGDMPVSAAQALQAFKDAGYRLLDVTPAHVLAVESLPPWHKDPFDRLLAAQAISEPLRLLTADGALARYGELILVV